MNPIAKRTISALTTAALVVLAIIYAPPAWLRPAFAVLIALSFLELCLLLKKKLVGLRLVLGAIVGLAVLCLLGALPAIAVVCDSP